MISHCCQETFNDVFNNSIIAINFWLKDKRYQITEEITKKNKCSERSMEVKLPALLGNYDRPTNRRTNQPRDRQMYF